MDFSDCLPLTGTGPVYSPDRKLLASAQDYRVVVRDVESLSVVGLFSCLDRVEQVAWSPNSDHILCGLFKRATIQVFCVSDPEWTCSIAEGPAGIVNARWSPDGQHILITADFQIRLAVWSLVTQECEYLKGPKHPAAGLAFSPDGTQLAVAGRSDCKDYVALYDCATWACTRQFGVATLDLADLAWSPDGACIAAWDSAANGHLVAVYTPEGECLTAYSAYRDLLGVKSVAWSPSGQLLAVGGFDQELHVLNHVTWGPLAQLAHPTTVTGPAAMVVYSEVEEHNGRPVLADQNSVSSPPPRPPATRASTLGRPLRAGSPTKPARPSEAADAEPPLATKSRYIVSELPFRIPTQKAPLDKADPKLGIGSASWSFDGSFVATRCDSQPSVVWVWDTSRLELASVLVQARAVRATQWDPTSNRLVICTGDSKLYLWSPEGASCVHIPLPGFRASALQWHADGTSMVLSGRDSFCVAYIESAGTA